MAIEDHHILLLACPGQGHINPTFQLAKRLARAGPRVTFATSANALRPINIPSNLSRLSLASFSTGSDDHVSAKSNPHDDPRAGLENFKRVVSTSIHDLIISLSNQDRPISLLIYTLMIPWAADMARELHIPSAFFCIQSAAAFAIYTHYFHNDDNTPISSITLPGLPPFESDDLPTFLLPSSPHYFTVPTFEDHIRVLERDPNPTVLVNSFDALEEQAIRAVDLGRLKMITIGPLIPSGFCDGSDVSDTFYGCDQFENSRDYVTWLGSKADKSVVYVSFGTMAVIKKKFFEEILNGLALTGRPFLWTIRPNKILGDGNDGDSVTEDMVTNSGLGQGLFIPWCSQVEVLAHSSIGCVLTHCGWNSTLESIVMGVPIVGVPLISDQPMNAKMVEEVWKVGLRAKTIEEGVVDREEVRRCLEVVMGSEEIRKSAKKWATLALDATKEKGSSHTNLSQFLDL